MKWNDNGPNSLTLILIFFNLMNARLLILGWDFLDHFLDFGIDVIDPPGVLDSIELGRGGVPVTLKGIEYL